MKLSRPQVLSPKRAPFLGLTLSLLAVAAFLPLNSCGGGSSPAAGAKAGNGGGGNKGGGNKGGGNGGQKKLNQGNFEIKAFGYKDDRPASFQPLRKKIFEGRKQEEVAFLRTNITRGSFKGSSGAVLDDKLGKPGKPLLPVPIPILGSMKFQASCSGSWDEKFGDELVSLGMVGKEFTVDVLTKDRRKQNNGWGHLLLKKFPKLGNVLRTSACMGDIDDDGREEILILVLYASNGMYVQRSIVLDDSRTKGAILLDRVDGTSATFSGIGIHAGDFDGDGKDEILLSRWFKNSCSVQLLGDKSTGFQRRGLWTEVGEKPIQYVFTILGVQVGNMDRDGAMEFAVTSSKTASNLRGSALSRSRIYDLSAQGKPKLQQTLEGGVFFGFNLSLSLSHVLSADLNGDGVQEILCFGTRVDVLKRHELIALHMSPQDDRGLWDEDRNFVRSGLGLEGQLNSVVAVDDDGDHRDEVLVGYGFSQRLKTEVFRYEMGKQSKSTKYSLGAPKPLASQFNEAANRIAMTPGDFDGENLLLETTNKKWLTLSNPIPIVILAAAPTKAGISQNYSGSTTGYSLSKGKTVSHSVTTTNSITLSKGIKGNYGELFEIGVQSKITRSVGETLSKAVTVTKTNAFFGTFDKDVIVFQGTLYMRYQYKIVGSRYPRLRGKLFTIDEPVSTRIYKWTVDFFNKNVSAPARIGKDILTHKVGDPSSYLSKAKAQTYSNIPGTWIHEKGLTVGQGRSQNGLSIQLDKSNSTEKSRSYGVTDEWSFKIGPFSGGSSYGLNKTHVYSISIHEGTLYSGTIGDIDKGQDFSDWVYGTGLFIRRVGVDAKGKNLPGKLPYQLVTWWTQPLGTHYK